MKVPPIPRRERDPEPDAPRQTHRTNPLLQLQTQVGNAAVSAMLQRQKTENEDPNDQDVVRREVHGLRYGLKSGFQPSYHSAKRDQDVASDESHKTAGSPEHMAVVLLPARPIGKGPVQVILHFHGLGFRGGDPYAGYLAAKDDKGHAKGSTRDQNQEHWEQQIGAVAQERTTGPAIVTILAQGRGFFDFGDVPTAAYIADVFQHVDELKNITDYTLIQTGHSAGGFKVKEALNSRKEPPPGMVVMFDAEAMSGAKGVADWAKGQIGRLDATIRAALQSEKPAEAQAAIAAAPKLRAYFASHGAYDGVYRAANQEIGALIDRIPAPYGTPSSAAVTVADLFRFVAVEGVSHEFVISKGRNGNARDGAVADALRASTDPTVDRAQALAWHGKATPVSPAHAAPKKAAAPAVPAAPVVPGKAQTPHGAPAAVVPGKIQTPNAPAAVPASKGWRSSGATSEYLLTQKQRDDLAASTPKQRAADAKELSGKRERLKKLAAAEKKGLSEADAKELAELRDLQKKVAATSMALKQSDVEDIIKAAGHTVDGWYGEVVAGTFLNVGVRVHRHMADALQKAEATLVGNAQVNPAGLDAAALGKKLGMSPRASDMRIPKSAVGGTSISMHTFGLAVDLNYAGNPYLALNGRTAPDVIVRASSLVTNAPVDVAKSLGDTKESFDRLTSASQALATYLSFKDPANRPALRAAIAAHTPARGEPHDEAGWLHQIEHDHRAITSSKDFAGHTSPEKGFLDIPEAVVNALTGAGMTWGGTYSSTKDLMHFDLRSGEGAKIHAARTAHSANR